MLMTPACASENCANCVSHSISVFSNAAESVAQKASREREAGSYRRGEVLFSRGEKARGVYCVRSGVVKLYREIPEEREHLVRLLGAGDVFGLGCVHGDETHHLTAKVVEDAKVCLFSPESFKSLLSDSNTLGSEVAHRIWASLKNLEENSGRMAGRSVRERMAFTLLNLSRQFGVKTPYGIRINVRLSREEIASLAGTVIESAVRHLSEFKEEGLIVAEGRRLTVSKPEELEKIAGS